MKEEKEALQQTSLQFDSVLGECRAVFAAKAKDYGASWRIMRPSTLTDQIFIKARRIRNLETGTEPLIADDIRSEFSGIVNYGICALLQLELQPVTSADLTAADSVDAYSRKAAEVKALMMAKNHDYGEAWRQMRVSSFTDIILTKLQRIKEIEDNGGKTAVSEGIGSNYMDIINYAVFALIKLSEENDA